MFHFGSGLKQPNNFQNPSPSAPPMVYSSPDYPGRQIQMPQPFGSGIGIGFKPHVFNHPNHNGYMPQPSSYPHNNQATLPSAHYQNYAQSHNTNYSQRSQPLSPQMDPWIHQSAQNTQTQHNFQSNIYPNLYQFPHSYQPYPQMQRMQNFTPKGTPTVLPYENFDPQVDAATLRKAMKGFGCDEKAVIEVLCRRNNQQRQEIAKVFKTNFGKDLIENIQSETRGNFENLLVALLTPTLDFYCKEIKEAMDGIGTDEQVLIEILCTLSNYEINLIKAHFNKLYKKDLETAIIGETSGNFKRLLVALCTAGRDESGETDLDKAKADATALLRAGELMFGTDESVFNSILCQRNYQQLKLIFQEYQTMTGHSFEQAIKNEFSGDIKEGFKAIFRCVNNKAEFFAHQLMKSMKGIGTNDRQLIRLVVTRCEIDMTEIKEAFERLFGETLKDCIKGDTSGDYKHALYLLIGENKSS